MKTLSLFALLLVSFVCMGQTPANTVLIGAEGITIASTTGTNVVYQFGSGDSFEEVSDASYPLIVDCAVKAICDTLGGDPAPSTPKSIYAVEQATAYTVTVLGVPMPITVPAAGSTTSAPTTSACALPTAYTPVPVIPAKPANCSLATGAVAVAADGQMVMMLNTTNVVYFQYCRGAVCNAPFIYGSQPIIVGTYAALGGNPSTDSGVGTLYILPSNFYTGLAIAQGPISMISIAATTISK